MSGKLFVHVGAGKTGTSALQIFFAANREKLEEQGVLFPGPGLVSRNSGLQHHPLSDHVQYANPKALKGWERIGSLDAPLMIVSSEFFHSKIEAAGGLEFFQAVKEALGDKDVRIVFYFRRQIQWMQSAWSEWVKGGNQGLRFSGFVNNYKKSQIAQIHMFASVFGAKNVIVRPFEKSQFHGGTIQRDFIELTGLSWDDDFVIPEGNPNPRLTPDALELKRLINRFAKTTGELRELQLDLLDYSGKTSADSNSIFHSHGHMSHAAQVAYERALEPQYSEIARTFLGREDGVLFRDGFCDESPKQIAASESEAAISTDQAIAFLILQMYRKSEAQRRRIKALEDRLGE